MFTSLDGQQYVSHGQFDFDLRRKDIPINHLLPDDETAQGFTFTKLLPTAVQARYVRFKVTPKRILGISEVQALDFVKYEPFDLRIALPDEAPVVRGSPDPAPGATARSQESGRPAVGGSGEVGRPAPNAARRGRVGGGIAHAPLSGRPLVDWRRCQSECASHRPVSPA